MFRTGLEASRGYRFQRGVSLQPSLEVVQVDDAGSLIASPAPERGAERHGGYCCIGLFRNT